ncbi:hypothetical protein FRC11_008520 [Ceratobasidium sp. 423]|nr:hypothetical protein FRC11_008520 [Ceratobasidium sp. 423]
MIFSTLARSTSTLSRRVFTPRPSQLARFKSSSTTYSISPSPSSVVRLEIAVTSKEVTLRLVEAKTETDSMGTKAAKTTIVKAVGSGKESKAPSAIPVPIASKPTKKESPDSVRSTEIVECWVDGSNTHIAIVIGSRYKTFVLKDGWMTKTRDVNWAETAAIELAVEYLAQHGYTGLALIKSDSTAALIAVTGGTVGVPEVMESAHRTGSVIEALKTNLAIETVKVPSKNNIAHQFSRGTIVNADGYEELEGNLTIPEALVPFVKAL